MSRRPAAALLVALAAALFTLRRRIARRLTAATGTNVVTVKLDGGAEGGRSR